MALTDLVAQHGLGLVFLGTLVEGETVLLLAGFAAHRGLLSLFDVVLLGAAAATLAGQLSYFAGARFGARLFARFPAAAVRVQRLRPLAERHPYLAVIVVRFAYGLRTAGPAALAMLGVPRWRFAWLNLVGSSLWSLLFCTLGYHFGQAMQWLLDDLRAVEELLLALLVCAALGWALLRRLRRS